MNDYFGLRPDMVHSWAGAFRKRVGVQNVPLRVGFQLEKSAVELFSGITEHFKDAYKFFQNDLYKFPAESPSLRAGGDDVVWINMDEVGFVHLPPKKALKKVGGAQPKMQRNRDWKFSLGLCTTNRADLIVPPFVCVDKATEDERLSAQKIAEKCGLVFYGSPFNSVVMRRWVQGTLIPCVTSYVEKTAASDPGKASRMRFVLLLDNLAAHKAACPSDKQLRPGFWTKYLPVYSTSVMQPVDHIVARLVKDFVRALGSFCEALPGALMVALKAAELVQKRHNSDKVFVECGHDHKRQTELPLLSSLHSRFRAWHEEQAVAQDDDLYWGEQPLASELEKTENADWRAIAQWCFEEGVSMKANRPEVFQQAELDSLKAHMLA